MNTAPPVAVVTGAGRGIGAAITHAVLSRGGSVVAADLDTGPLQELQRTKPERLVTVTADACDEHAVSGLFTTAITHFGRVDAVFANAGFVGVRGPFEETPLPDFRHTIDGLLTSVFLAFKYGIRTMRAQGHGSLVATGSVASIHGGLGPHAYTAAKHGVKGLVESAAAEISSYGLTANAVAPGGTVSSLSAGLFGHRDDLNEAYERLAQTASSGVPTTAADIAAAAAFLAFDAPRINGVTLVIDGGDAILPSQGKAHYAAQTIESMKGHTHAVKH